MHAVKLGERRWCPVQPRPEARRAENGAIKSTPLHATLSMRMAAQRIQPSLSDEDIRSVWEAMWSAGVAPAQREPEGGRPDLSYGRRQALRYAAEDAIDALDPRFDPFIVEVSNPEEILALLDMAERGAHMRAPATPM